LSVPGVPLRIVRRGNNRQAVFFQEKDYIARLGPCLSPLFVMTYPYTLGCA